MTTNDRPPSPTPSNDAAGESPDNAANNPQKLRLHRNYLDAEPTPTIPDDEIPKILKGARRGVLEDMKILVGLIEDGGRNLPFEVTDEAFEIFVLHVKKPYVPKEPMKRKLIRFELVYRSLTGFRVLGKVFFMNIKRGVEMAKIWDVVYRWLNILVDAYLDGTFKEDNPVVSVSAYTFMVYRDIGINAVKHIFDTPEVFKFAFRLWKDDSDADQGCINSGSIPLAIMCGQMDFDIKNGPFLDVAVEMYEEMGYEDGKEGGIVKIAINRLVTEIQNEEYREGAVCFQLDTLYLFAKEDDHYGNMKMLGRHEIGLASVAYAFMKLTEANMLWINRTLTAARAIHLLESHLCRDRPFDAIQMTDVLRHGLMEGLFNFIRHYQWLENKGSLLNILDRLLDLLSVPSVLDAAVDGLRRSSTDVDFDESSPGLNPLVSRLKMIKKIVLERLIMKRMFKVVGREELGFCAKNSCHRIGPRSSFKKCSSCHFALYCSPECQSSSWKEHRELCSLLASDNVSDYQDRVETRPSDRLPRKISILELSRLIPNLSELVNKSQTKQISTSRIGFMVDVSSFPTRISAFDISTFATKADFNDPLTVLCADVLGDARSWQGDYQATVLRVKHLHDSFVSVIPVKKSSFGVQTSNEENMSTPEPDSNWLNAFACQDRYGRPLKPRKGDEVGEIARLIEKEAEASGDKESESESSVDSEKEAKEAEGEDSKTMVDIWDDAFIDGVIEKYLQGSADKQ